MPSFAILVSFIYIDQVRVQLNSLMVQRSVLVVSITDIIDPHAYVIKNSYG